MPELNPSYRTKGQEVRGREESDDDTVLGELYTLQATGGGLREGKSYS